MSQQPELTYRSGTADDWPVIAPVVQETWEWGDYIDEDVWQAWVSDFGTRQHLIIAEQDGAAVAFARLCELSDGEWWLEGVRVAPDKRGQGIGGALMEYMMAIFMREGLGFVRFATGSTNDSMQMLADEHGFRHVGKYALMEAAPELFDYRPFKIMQAQNAGLAQQYLRASPMHRVNKFVEQDWTLYYLTGERLLAYLSNPHVQVLGWRHMDKLLGLVILFGDESGEDEGSPLRLGYLDAPDDTTLRAMLNGLRGLALKRGHDRISWKIPLGVGLEAASADCGLASQWESELWLFEFQKR